MSIYEHAPLRFITAGSVDDGKSTLIGRLLYDSKALLNDQLQHLHKADGIDFSKLTDGLEAEREQGITIDVAYRYFSTAKRKFIIADTPGHEQYTRNMVTGASTADAAVVLIDASQLDFSQSPLDLLPQTKRHSAILQQLACPQIIVAVNKMDLLNFEQAKFEAICEAYRLLVQQIGLANIHFVPISALNGDNVVYSSDHTPWYEGLPLLPLLESIPHDRSVSTQKQDFHFPVQYVLRVDSHKQDDFRGYQGKIEAGSITEGDCVRVEPAGLISIVEEIYSPAGRVKTASTGEVVTLRLKDDIDISRGDSLVAVDNPIQASQSLTATLCWFDQKPLNKARKYLLKHTTNHVFARVKQIDYVLDVKTLSKAHEAENLELNDLGQVQLSLQKPICANTYDHNIGTGAFILIDEASYHTVAAGMIVAVQ